MCDRSTGGSIIPASRGKVEFDDADSGREVEVLEHLLRRAVAETTRARLAGLDLRPLQAKFDEGLLVQTGDTVSADALLEQLGTIPGLSDRSKPPTLRPTRRSATSSPARTV